MNEKRAPPGLSSLVKTRFFLVREGELNPHALRALEPESSASAYSATRALGVPSGPSPFRGERLPTSRRLARCRGWIHIRFRGHLLGRPTPLTSHPMRSASSPEHTANTQQALRRPSEALRRGSTPPRSAPTPQPHRRPRPHRRSQRRSHLRTQAPHPHLPRPLPAPPPRAGHCPGTPSTIQL